MLPNPAINPPRFPSPTKRSLSRSPVRRHARDFDPLLRDLSPSTTLRAFTAGSNGAVSNSQLAASYSNATESERRLGAKAAQACLDLRAWTRELESWEWPGTFDAPGSEHQKTQKSVKGLGAEVEGDEDVYWGSLPALKVQRYEKRVLQVERGLDEMDVEQLKEYVAYAHQMPDSASIHERPTSSGSTHKRLDDFTAVITATIFQALPYLSSLNQLLDIWTIRLSVLRQTPAYMRGLQQVRVDLDHGWAAIASSPTIASQAASAAFTRSIVADMKTVIDAHIADLGQRLDAFLDELEGQQETVPETWIETFETLESDYGTWVVQAEHKALETEWQLQHAEEKSAKASAAQNATVRVPDVSPVRPPVEQDEHAETETRSVSPVSAASRPHSGLNFFPDSDEPSLAQEVDMPREDSHTLADAEAFHVGPYEDAIIDGGAEPDLASERPKHVPIIINFGEDGVLYPNAADEQHTDEAPPVPAPLQAPSVTPAIAQEMSVKKRAAFLELERASSLQKNSRSPVRSFEHASNAFTRLFKRDKTPEQSRSNSLRSSISSKRDSVGSTDKRASIGSGKLDTSAGTVMWGGRKPASPVLGSNKKTAAERPSARNSQQSFSSLTRSGMWDVEGQSGNVPKDYTDMPGGFRSRSHSDTSRRSLQRTSSATLRSEHPPEEHRLRQMRAPETEKPSMSRRRSSPLRSTKEEDEVSDYPADWPLASPPDTEPTSPVKDAGSAEFGDEEREGDEEDEADTGPEIASPKIPIESDAFDRMFVGTLPLSPEEPRKTPVASKASETRPEMAPQRNSEPVLDSSMLDPDDADEMQGVDSMDPDWLVADHRDSLTLAEAGLPHVSSQSDSPVTGRAARSLPGASKGKMASPDYFPLQALPQYPPSATQRSHSNASGGVARSKSPSTSPMLLRLRIPPSPTGGTIPLADGKDTNDNVIKRASMTSIESHPRSSLRSLDLPRRGSISSMGSIPQTSGDSSAPVSAIEPSSAKSPMSYRGILNFPAPPHRNSASSPVSPIQRGPTPTTSRQGRSPSDSPAPLNAAMSKRQNKTPAKTANGSPSALAKSNMNSPLKAGEDNIDRHVSEVLDRLPSTSIRFKSRLGGDTPVSRTAEPRNYSGPRPKAVSINTSGAGSITLAPADPSPRKSAENEVKVYHLTQAGKEEPIKLFVRLVGETERVMVRVGGGWADLAEYLTGWAEHHGSRTVSGSGVEVQTADGNSSRKTSGAADTKSKRPGTPSAAPLRPGSNDGPPPWMTADPPHFSMGDSTDTDHDGPLHFTPLPQTSKNISQRSTPKSASLKGSRPSTADTLRPSSRQDWTEMGGLAGPGSAKRNELPEQKARWVEGMIERTKAGASAEKGKDKQVAELGKVGATRRMIFKNSPGVAGGGAENTKP